MTYANPFPILSKKNNSIRCVKQEITANNESKPIDHKITNRLPFMSPQIPQKYAPNIIPKKYKYLL